LGDHQAASRLAQAAVESMGLAQGLHYYLVWAWCNLPMSDLDRMNWPNAWRLDIADGRSRKRAAVRAYMDCIAPCGNPYCGVLPHGLVSAAGKSYELFVFAGQPGSSSVTCAGLAASRPQIAPKRIE
jgi:hypothetical protein